MIKFVDGDFFDYDTDIRVNTVNCVGVMGAGVALVFKKKYPEMYKEYVNKCKKNEVRPGEPYTWSKGDLYTKKLTIINFPTKNHWRNKSEYEYVEDGLRWLQEYLINKENESVTLPALGCGHGGLDWDRIKNMIKKYLSNSPAEILVFNPSSSKQVEKNIGLTPERIQELRNNNIMIIENTNTKYPEYLKIFSEKSFYAYGNLSLLKKKSFSLICSTKPDKKEQKIIQDFFNMAKHKNINIIVGSSAFDKKNMKTLNEYTFICILPSGMKIFCDKKINKKLCNNSNLLLSAGDPFVEFDRSEFINSVLTRIYLSTNVLFTTPKLDWLQKYSKRLSMFNGKMYYTDYEEIVDNTKNTLQDMNIEKISGDDFDDINFF